MSKQRHRNPPTHRVHRRRNNSGTAWSYALNRSKGDELLACAKAGLASQARRLLADHSGAYADVLIPALITAEVELRCARTDEDERAYMDTLAALLDAGAPPSALLPDMSDVLAELRSRSYASTLPPVAETAVRRRL
jgi:hypothetical protein